MYKLGIKLKRLLLVIGDLVIFQAALLLTLWLRYGAIETHIWNLHFLPFGILSLLWIVGSYVTGLYDLDVLKNGIKFFRLYLEGMIANLAIALAYFYLIPIFNIEPRTNLFLYFAIVLLLGYGWRLAYNRFLTNTLFKNRVLFVGPGADAIKIRNLFEKNGFGFMLAAVFETTPGSRFDDERIAWYMSTESIQSIINEQRIHTILLGHKPDEVPGLRDSLYETLFTSVNLLDRAALEEAITGRIPLEYISQTWFLEHLRENEKTWYEVIKRLGDFILAIPIGLVTLVLYPFIALLIKLTSPGSVLYSQIRVGRMGKLFRIWKFRSMIQDAETDGRPQFATKDDERITKFGKILRASRIDELPQIWNVLRGEMSLIGPRPERPEFAEELTRQMPYYALRHLIRPGLTGWAQVKFPYAGTFEDNLIKLQFDLYYIKHRSFLIDVAILLKTIGIILRRQGT
ncbi:MAG: sugar transferase [Patescibacteria group bacterium]|nr:sugar transferase [Patescibacteria group bacterium]MBU2509096.1 sugar transferase [Patescibacteria group bacterium]